jgi:hypothetical protein
MSSQLSFFGVDPDHEFLFHVFHDESGNYIPHAGDRWLLHGVLFMPSEFLSESVSILGSIRDREKYHREVHFVNLRKSRSGSKARCMVGWLDTYARILSHKCFFHCLAIDTQSSAFNHSKFSEPFHVYNSFAKTAIVGGIAWSLSSYSNVAIRLFSHERSLVQGDNFLDYLPGAVFNQVKSNSKRRGAKYPQLRLLDTKVTFIPSKPSEVRPELCEECEIIQLTDLLTSSISQSLRASSDQLAKIDIAGIVSQWIVDTRRKPWLQEYDLHKRYSFSCFPNEKGEFYDPRLETRYRDQSELFSYE